MFVVDILGVVSGVGPGGKVLVAVRDQRGEGMHGVGRLDHWNLVGLQRERERERERKRDFISECTVNMDYFLCAQLVNQKERLGSSPFTG